MRKSQPSVILLTDTHYGKNNLEDVNDIFQQAFDLADSLSVDKIFHLGDVFTNRTGQGLLTLLSFFRVLDMAAKRNITIHFIAGNHDKTDLEDESSYLDIFSHHPAAEIYRKETFAKIGGLSCHFLPFFPEDGTYPERLKESARKTKLGVKHYLFTHIAFDSVVNNDGTKVENGLKSKLCQNFDKVFVGHYHNRSKVGKNIHYIGSAFPQNFGEDNEKGFTVLYSCGKTKFIKAQFKEYYTYWVDADKENVEDVVDIMGLVPDIEENKITARIVFTGSEANLSAVDGIYLKELGFKVEKRSNSALKSISDAKKGKKVQHTNQSIQKKFIKYCVENGIKGEKFKAGKEFMKNIKNQ